MAKKYLANGQEVSVIQKLADGYLVSCLYHYGSGEDYDDQDNIRIVAQVFDAPPVARFAADVSALREEVDRLSDQRAEIYQRIQQADEMEAAAIARLKRVKALERLGDFIDGKVTHYAHIPNYGSPKVWEFGNEKDEYRRDSLKLLTLFGKSNGELEWNLNKYSDGSGAQYLVMPATSHDEAMEFARQSILDRALATTDKPREDVIKAAEEFGVQLDPAYVSKFKAMMLNVERSNLHRAQKVVADIEKRIETFSRT